MSRGKHRCRHHAGREREERAHRFDQKADTETVNAAIQELQDAISALEAVKDNYVSADAELKAVLENKIAAAKNDAIDLVNAKVAPEVQDAQQQIFLMVICIIACLSLAGNIAIAAVLILHRKRTN